jgi:DNA-binding beta-propeller fold protein YncE
MSKMPAAFTLGMFVVSMVAANAQTAVLTPGTAIAVPGSGAHFDYMTFDGKNNRVFASEPGAKALVYVDVATGKLTQVPLGVEVNGVAVDTVDNKFFTAGGGGKLFDFDRDTLKQNDEVDLGAPADSILFVRSLDTLYIDNDDGTKIWAVNGKTDAITATITIAGAPEYMAFDPKTKHLFQNIKATNSIQEMDATTNAIIATWPTAPATSPHGLAYDPESNKLFSAGKNKTLVEIDATTGAVVNSVTLASATDQIAFDRKLRRLYAPGGGFITVVSIANDGTPTVLGQITTPKGAHTLAVDPNTSTVWISYPADDGSASFLQPFTPSP